MRSLRPRQRAAECYALFRTNRSLGLSLFLTRELPAEGPEGLRTMTSKPRHHAGAVAARRRGELHRGGGEVGSLDELRAEARYRRERLALYKARLYAGRARGLGKLRDLQRSSDGAAERLRRAKENLGARSSLARASRSSEEIAR